MKAKEFKQYHVTRNLGKHALALDNRLYGSPMLDEKEEDDWAVSDPEKYISLLYQEKKELQRSLEDMTYILKVKKIEMTYVLKSYSTQAADAHIYHLFTRRSFNYVEKIAYQLRSKAPDTIDLNVPKARRQLYAIIAALNDIEVSIVRFEAYAKSLKASDIEAE